MTVYVYGTSQVTQQTIPHKITGFQLKGMQLLNNHTDTNHILLHNKQRIDGKVTLSLQVPDFASVVLCASGKGGRKGNKDNISGMIYYSL